MANLPESAVYDSGVYQLETTDPVQGGASGVSNTPLKNLANRTTYLKQRVDGIEAGTTTLPGYAKLSGPTFTDDPKAPTPPLGDNDTSIATTAFVQGTLGFVLSKSVAGSGNVTLTAVEAGSGILVFTGALTGARNIIVPTSPSRPWVVRNNTSGAFALTVKTAAGTGIVVPQGTRMILFTDGTNVLDATSAFGDLTWDGSNTLGVTPPQFDSTKKLATSEFVRRELGSNAGRRSLSVNTTLSAADVGYLVTLAANNLTVTLPNPGGLPVGAVITINGAGSAGCKVVTASGELFTNAVVAEVPILNGSSASFCAVSGTRWEVYGTGGAGGAVGGGDDRVFWENDQTVDHDYTITAGKNAMSAGPITISDGKTVTVPDGSVWTIV